MWAQAYKEFFRIYQIVALAISQLYHGTWADTMVTFEIPCVLYAHNMPDYECFYVQAAMPTSLKLRHLEFSSRQELSGK